MSKVFIVDDDPIHQRIVQIMIDKHRIYDTYLSFTSARGALDYLLENINSNEVLPEVILLDLNMPRKDGREVLREIKADPKFQHIPVIALTTSQAEKDVVDTYQNGVSGFITKPVEFSGLREVMKSIGMYWLNTARLPPE